MQDGKVNLSSKTEWIDQSHSVESALYGSLRYYILCFFPHPAPPTVNKDNEIDFESCSAFQSTGQLNKKSPIDQFNGTESMQRTYFDNEYEFISRVAKDVV